MLVRSCEEKSVAVCQKEGDRGKFRQKKWIPHRGRALRAHTRRSCASGARAPRTRGRPSISKRVGCPISARQRRSGRSPHVEVVLGVLAERRAGAVDGLV